MFKRVLVAMDPERSAWAALDRATALAAPGATVTICSVLPPGRRSGGARAAVHDAEDHLRGLGYDVRGEVRESHRLSPARAIVAVAREAEADLVVLGRPHRPRARVSLGSVGHSVVAGLDCAVLVVDAEAVERQSTTPRRVMLAVDDDGLAPGAARLTAEIARDLDAEVLVVHVLDLAISSESRRLLPHAHARDLIESVRTLLAVFGVRSTSWLVPGEADGISGEIAASAEEWGADLIVVGSRRLHEVAGAVLISVSNALPGRTTLPVLLAPRQAREEEERGQTEVSPMRSRVSDVMSSPAVTVAAGAGFRDVAAVLREHAISGAPVVDAAGHVVGVVSEADLVVKEERGELEAGHRLLASKATRTARRKARGTVAEDVMTSPAVVIEPDRTVADAARTMHRRGIKRLPVVDGEGHLVGVVSRADVLKVFLRPDDDIAREIRDGVIRDALGLDPDTIQVYVAEGAVHLDGEVGRASQERALLRLAEQVEGVVSVTSDVAATLDDVQPPYNPWPPIG